MILPQIIIKSIFVGVGFIWSTRGKTLHTCFPPFCSDRAEIYSLRYILFIELQRLIT
jgi:hypothetical protein